MPHFNHSASSIAPLADSRRHLFSETFLSLAALILTIMDLGRRLVIFFLRIIFKIGVKTFFAALLAAVFILGYCVFMALHLALGPAVNSQIP